MRTSSTLLAVALTGTLALSAAPANAEVIRESVPCNKVQAKPPKVNYSFETGFWNSSTTIYYHSHCKSKVYLYVDMVSDVPLGTRCISIKAGEKNNRKYDGSPRKGSFRLGKACPK